MERERCCSRSQLEKVVRYTQFDFVEHIVIDSRADLFMPQDELCLDYPFGFRQGRPDESPQVMRLHWYLPVLIDQSHRLCILLHDGADRDGGKGPRGEPWSLAVATPAIEARKEVLRGNETRRDPGLNGLVGLIGKRDVAELDLVFPSNV